MEKSWQAGSDSEKAHGATASQLTFVDQHDRSFDER